MQVSSIQFSNMSPVLHKKVNCGGKTGAIPSAQNAAMQLNNVPISYWQAIPISFKAGDLKSGKTIPDIEHNNYTAMTENTKKRMRKRYESFFRSECIDKTGLFDQKNYQYMPLRTEETMDQFLKFSKLYNNYKDQPIVCVGRSPKWFLNASLWMKDGIEGYKFAAFSGYWYRKHPVEGLKPINGELPTPEEEAAYEKYLRRIKVDPVTIVNDMKTTGKKTVITDFIHTGRGLSSFIGILSKIAEEKGILEDFSKSIELVCIGSMEYEGMLDPYADTLDTPRVLYPPRLRPYSKNIKQQFFSMPAIVLEEMLINQNTNECRSTYYPHNAWTVYKPDQFKTGRIFDMKKVEQKIKELKEHGKRCMTQFSSTMADYRNLLNFRILDGLNARGILRETPIRKIR